MSVLPRIPQASPPPVDGESAAADSARVLDFENGGLEGWSVRPGDEPFLTRLEILREAPLNGSGSLWVEARGWNRSSPPGNELVLVSYRLERPVRADSSTQISWQWWFRDRAENDGVGLGFHFADSAGRGDFCFERLSHSLKQRGSWPYDDPEGRPIRHRISLREAFRSHDARDWPPPPWFLRQVDFYCVTPQDQAASLDDLRVGPPTGASPEEGLARVSSPVTAPATCMAFGDLDGDGRLDRILGQAGAPPLILLGRAGGEARPVGPTEAGLDSLVSPLRIVLADLDQDGRVDLAALGRRGVKVFHGLGGGEYRLRSVIRPADLVRPTPDDIEARVLEKLPGDLLASDFDASPGLELLLLRTVSLRFDSLYRQAGPGRWKARPFGEPCLGPPLGAHWGQWRAHAKGGLADIDGDLDLDLFLANSDLFLREAEGWRCAGPERLPEFGLCQGAPVFGDIDNDGDMDLFVPVDIGRNLPGPRLTHAHSLLYRNDGGRFVDVSERLAGVETKHVGGALLEDFDGDGDLDLFLTHASWDIGPRPSNSFLENDGAGRFRKVEVGFSWTLDTPSALAAECADADGDGDVDLLLLRRQDRRVVLQENPGDGRRSVRVRVLDQRGAPHAAGASVVLRDRSEDRRVLGYRQTGVGSLRTAGGELLFVGPVDRACDLEVSFPGPSARPVVRRGLKAGDRVTVVEPAWAGPGGSLASRVGVAARRAVDVLAGAGWPAMLPCGLGCGVAAGAFLCARRRKLARALEPVRGALSRRRQDRSPAACAAAIETPLPGPWALRAVGLVLFLFVGIVLLVSMSPFWPEHHRARQGRLLATAGLFAGACSGAGAVFAERRRRTLAPRVESDAVAASAQLIEAFDGFAHAQWLRYLGGTASLARSLVEGADPEAVGPRLASRLQSYAEVVRPQVRRILDLLPLVDLPETLRAAFRDDAAIIEHGISIAERLFAGKAVPAGNAAARRASPSVALESDLLAEGALLELSAATSRLQTTVEAVFQELGRRMQAAPAALVVAAVARAREDYPEVEFTLDLPASLPPVFAVAGDLANILENLLANAARASLRVRERRAPRVLVEAERPGGLLVLAVSDTGDGIHRDRWDSLFEGRAVDPARRGRGLPYARRRLRGWDGKISLVRSSPDEGTRIEVVVRALDPADPHSAT